MFTSVLLYLPNLPESQAVHATATDSAGWNILIGATGMDKTLVSELGLENLGRRIFAGSRLFRLEYSIARDIHPLRGRFSRFARLPISRGLL